LASFWEKDEDGTRGKVLRFDTDILQSQAYPWWAKIKAGAAAKDAPARLPTREPKYDTLAGLDGVWIWSDPVPVERGKAYWMTVDAKGPGQMFAWLIGYTNAPDVAYGAEMAAFQGYLQDPAGTAQPGRNHKGFLHSYVWKGQLNMIGTGAWKTYSRREKPFRPTAVTPEVCYVRVLLWAIWPPGEYRFDNVRLCEVPDKAAP
jgi:hypothetical protein